MDVNDVMHRKRAEDLGDFEKVSDLSSWLGRRRLTFASTPKAGQWPCDGCTRDGGGGGKVSIERLCISLLMSKNLFNSKVIKSFVAVLRSRKCFFVFRDSYVLCIYVTNILCTFPIFMYGYVYISNKGKCVF